MRSTAALLGAQAIFSFAALSGAQEIPQIVAHRGASLDAPENTLAAVLEAWRQEADAAEIDVRLTTDGQLVCVHDETTKRTADAELVVADSLAEAVLSLDAGSWFGSDFAGERVPKLDDVLASIPSGKRVFIDAKGGPELAEPICADVAEAVKAGCISPAQVTVMAFDARLAAAVKKTAPRLDVRWLASFKRDKGTGALSPTSEEVIATLDEIDADGAAVGFEPDIVTREFAGRLSERGWSLSVWTIDDGAVARNAVEAGAGTIITNAPARIREAFRAEE